MVHSSTLVVLAGLPSNPELYRKVTFPKKTHHQHNAETVYQEFFEQYTILRILKQDATLTPALSVGQAIKVFILPDQSEFQVRTLHETGMCGDSMAVPRIQPMSKVMADGVRILFLNPAEKDHSLFIRYDQDAEAPEGEATIPVVEEHLGLLRWDYDFDNVSVFYSEGLRLCYRRDGKFFCQKLTRSEDGVEEKVYFGKLSQAATLTVNDTLNRLPAQLKIPPAGTGVPEEEYVRVHMDAGLGHPQELFLWTRMITPALDPDLQAVLAFKPVLLTQVERIKPKQHRKKLESAKVIEPH